MDKIAEQKIYDLVKASQEPLVVIKENPGLDEAGSALGLYLILKRLGKNVHIACSLHIPEKFSFLPEYRSIEGRLSKEKLYKLSLNVGAGSIKELSYEQDGNTLNIYLTTQSAEIAKNISAFKPVRSKYDLILTMGSNNLRSLGRLYSENKELFSEVPVVNIGHNSLNERFGKVNLVETNFSTDAELMVELSKKISNAVLSDDIATLFLAGIIEKTNNFQSLKIAPETFITAGTLLNLGARREELIRNICGGSPDSKTLDSQKDDQKKDESGPEEDKKKAEDPSAGRVEAEKEIQDSGVNFLDISQEAIQYKLDELKANSDSSAKKNFFLTLGERVSKKSLFFLLIAIGAVLGAVFFRMQNSQLIFSLEKKKIFLVSQETSKSILSNMLGSVVKGVQKQDSNSGNGNLSVTSGPLPITVPDKEEKKTDGKITTSLVRQINEIGVPKKINIPKIDVDAKIQHVGLTKDGGMEVPSNLKDTGWFKLGPRPGDYGNAVIAGHLDGKYFAKGVFQNLEKLEKGDKIYVTDEYGIERIFRVTGKEIYSDQDAPLEKIFGASDSVHLNLITCEGVWDSKRNSYSQRLVVFTELEA